MPVIFFDLETFYDKQYSLRKLTPPEYILSDQFELICAAAQVDNGPIEDIDGPDFAKWLAQFDPAQTTMVAFNSLFDQSIVAWRYRFVPAKMLDMLGVSRALLGHRLRRLGLEYVAEHLGLGVKGSTIKTVLGMHRAEIIAAGLWPAFLEYNRQDVRLLRGVFDALMPQFPKDEIRVMDLVLRCAVEPRMIMNVPKLTAYYEHVKADKERLIAAAGVDKAQLLSSAEFVKVLENLGITVETKISSTGNEIPAIAKSDTFLNDLLEHEDAQVQAVAAARLGAKSTLNEARAARLLAIAQLPWPVPASMPVPLRYAGAHTHRLSGEWSINLQNLPRGGELRGALEAPAGHKVVTCDMSQIEARLAAWLSRSALLDVFVAGDDPYCFMASQIFGRPITKADTLERWCGKTATLGLQYGLGPDNFYIKTKAAARLQGIELGDMWTIELADRTVKTYRTVNVATVRFWRLLDGHLHRAWLGLGPPAIIGPITIGHGYIEMPGGLRMLYGDPRQVEGGDLMYDYGGIPRKIYGSACLENVCQGLARVILMNAALRLHATKIPFLRFVHQAHDELIFVVPDKYVDKAKIIVHSQMIIPPSWGSDIPLKADVGSAQAYGDAK
jgi:DNA polymerase